MLSWQSSRESILGDELVLVVACLLLIVGFELSISSSGMIIYTSFLKKDSCRDATCYVSTKLFANDNFDAKFTLTVFT